MKEVKEFVIAAMQDNKTLAKEMTLLSKTLETTTTSSKVIQDRINLYDKRINFIGHAIRAAINLQ